MNYQLINKELVYAIEGEFSFSKFELGCLADMFAETAEEKSFCGLTDDDGWLRLELIDVDPISDHQIVCFFADSASCEVMAEKFECRIASEEESSGKFVF